MRSGNTAEDDSDDDRLNAGRQGMLFHEIYGTYFSVIAAILKRAETGTMTRKDLLRITSERAFGESILTIPDALTDGTWPLLDEELKTCLRHAPSVPVTALQLRWLKTILNDPRVRLFAPDGARSASGESGAAGRASAEPGQTYDTSQDSAVRSETGTFEYLREILKVVEPLYDPRDIIYFDRNGNPDPFEDPDYIGKFRTVLCALRAKKSLHIRYAGSSREHEGIFIPLYLEYSEKDDQFRLRAAAASKTGSGMRGQCTLRMASILKCSIAGSFGTDTGSSDSAERRSVTLELTDERNALERALLHFSDLEKETTALGQNRYRIRILYYAEDESEILIRILSFGPMIRVISPESFVKKIRDRIDRQIRLSPRLGNLCRIV